MKYEQVLAVYVIKELNRVLIVLHRDRFCGKVFQTTKPNNTLNTQPHPLVYDSSVPATGIFEAALLWRGSSFIRSSSRYASVCSRVSVDDTKFIQQSKNCTCFCSILELTQTLKDAPVVSLGEVPLQVAKMGVFFRKILDQKQDWFENIADKHKFQRLTESESNKSDSFAYRHGIYLTPVEKTAHGHEFSLPRCSSNFEGPSENFSVTDSEVVARVEQLCKPFFRSDVKHEGFNHVLAQIYYNVHTTAYGKKKVKKSSISRHSDMPADGKIAFLTDFLYNNTSVKTSVS